MNRLNIIRAYDSRNAQANLLTKGLQASGEQVVSCNLELQSVKEKIEESALLPDVIHYHNASLVASQLSDVYVETNHPYATFIHYETSELRTRTEAIRFNPYANLVEYQDETVTNRLQQLAQLFPACIVKDYEAAGYAAKYHSRVYIVPYAIDLKWISPVLASPTRSDTPLKIIHPIANESKGTEFIELVMNRLWKEGYQFEYERIENFSHTDTLRKMQEADIIIDQLLHGSYGIVSIEAMALGKPVISHLRKDLKSTYDPTIPVISANPATLYCNLIPLLEDAGIRESAGKAGCKFVEEHHHSDAVINKLMWAYRNEIEYRQNSSLSDQRMIFDLMSGKLVEWEGTINISGGMNNNSPDYNSPDYNSPDYNSPNYNSPNYNSPNYNSPNYNSPDKHNVQTNISSTIGTTDVLQVDNGAINFKGGKHNSTPNKQNEQTIPPSNQTVTPTKSIHVIGSKQISKKPVVRNPFCSTKVRCFHPNRYYVTRKSSNKSSTYFSFNLSKLPKSSVITKAGIILPIIVKKKHKVSIVRINRKSSQKRTKGIPPIVLPKRIDQLSIKSVSRISNWKCTELVKRWHRNHSKNNGVLISKRLWKKPKLVVHFYKKC
jgi:hypothetical protein